MTVLKSIPMPKANPGRQANLPASTRKAEQAGEQAANALCDCKGCYVMTIKAQTFKNWTLFSSVNTHSHELLAWAFASTSFDKAADKTAPTMMLWRMDLS
jgi:hypothetical protein